MVWVCDINKGVSTVSANCNYGYTGVPCNILVIYKLKGSGNGKLVMNFVSITFMGPSVHR